MADESDETVDAPVERLLDVAHDAMAQGIGELRRQVGLVKEKLKHEHNSADASHLAFLMEKLSIAMRELRQHEKHERDAAASMSAEEEDECLIAHIRNLPVERREHLRKVLLEEPGSVL